MEQVRAYAILMGQVLEDGVDVALGQALRYERQATEYRRLADAFGRPELQYVAGECDEQAAFWRGLVERLRGEG